MGVLRTRVKRIEVKCAGENGIPKWAMEIAESLAQFEKWRIESLRHLHRAIEKETGIKKPKLRPAECQSELEKKQYALELYQKYQTYENYKKSSLIQNIPVSSLLKKLFDEFNQEDEGLGKGNQIE
jgi:hypothetical protein